MKRLRDSLPAETRVLGVTEAERDAEVVILATPWPNTEEAVRSAGSLAGKVLTDATNPLALGTEGLRRGLLIGHTTSAAEQVAEWAPGAKVVKAFNTTGAKNMGDSDYPEKLSMFICGNDADAKRTDRRLAEELGFEVVDAGGLFTARYLEPLAMLWIHLAFAEGFGMDFGFRLVRREAA